MSCKKIYENKKVLKEQIYDVKVNIDVAQTCSCCSVILPQVFNNSNILLLHTLETAAIQIRHD